MTIPGSSQSGHNEGIQANTVQADVLAVGHHAHATKYVAAEDTEALTQAIAQIRAAIAGLGLPPAAHDALAKDLQGLADAAQSGHADKRKAENHLTGIVDKLKTVGIVLNGVVGLAEPLTKIANLFHLPITVLTGG